MHSQHTAEQAFQDFNNENYWKLIVDFNQWKANDPLIFDKQESPGYLQSTTLALWYMLTTLDEPLSVDLLINLHDISYHDKSYLATLGLIKTGMSGLSSKSFSKAGLQELCEKMESQKTLLYFAFQFLEPVEGETKLMPLLPNVGNEPLSQYIQKALNNPEMVRRNFLLRVGFSKYMGLYLAKDFSLDETLKILNDYINNYQLEIQRATNTEQKLVAIVNIIRGLHQYHPFSDGNGRTFVFLLLNRLLINNGLTPCIMSDSGKFTGHSITELVKEVEEGQVRFKDKLCDSQIKQDLPLRDYLLKVTQLTQDKLNSLYIDKKLLEQKADELCSAIQNKKLSTVETILISVPVYQFLDLLQLAKAKQESPYLQELIQSVVMLKYYGASNNKKILTVVAHNPQHIEAIKNQIEVISRGNDLHLKQHEWLDLIADWVENKSVENPIEVLKAANIECYKLSKIGFLDDTAYIKLLQKNPVGLPIFKTWFQDNKLSIEIFFSDNHFESSDIQAENLDLFKKYIYKNPQTLEQLFLVIRTLPRKSFEQKEFWLELIVNHPEAGEALNKLIEGEVLFWRRDIFNLKLIQKEPSFTDDIVKIIKLLHPLLLLEKANIFFKEPTLVPKFLRAIQILEKNDLHKDRDLIKGCLENPENAVVLSLAAVKLNENNLFSESLLNSIITNPAKAKSVRAELISVKFQEQKLDKTFKAIRKYIAEPGNYLKIFPKTKTGAARAAAYLKVFDTIQNPGYLEKAIIVYSILTNNKGKDLHKAITTTLNYPSSINLLEHMKSFISRELRRHDEAFVNIEYRIINPLNKYATTHANENEKTYQLTILTDEFADLASRARHTKGRKL